MLRRIFDDFYYTDYITEGYQGTPAPQIKRLIRESLCKGSFKMYRNNIDSRRRVFAALCYFTWIGFVPILLISDKNDEFIRWHLNQALIINIALSAVAAAEAAAILFFSGNLYDAIDFIGAIVGILAVVGWVIGWCGALGGKTNTAPILGMIHLLK